MYAPSFVFEGNAPPLFQTRCCFVLFRVVVDVNLFTVRISSRHKVKIAVQRAGRVKMVETEKGKNERQYRT